MAEQTRLELAVIPRAGIVCDVSAFLGPIRVGEKREAGSASASKMSEACQDKRVKTRPVSEATFAAAA